ncbi:MAG: type II toxin-antitoxin system VapC family toxin [Gemmatimonadota bacterium]
MKPVVVDASVWISAVDAGDPMHSSAADCLAALGRRQIQIVVPRLARIEVACALSRRFGSAEVSREVAAALFDATFVIEEDLDGVLSSRAVLLGTTTKLRGADALYAAIAEREGAPLITLDRELLERSGAVSPGQWLTNELA